MEKLQSRSNEIFKQMGVPELASQAKVAPTQVLVENGNCYTNVDIETSKFRQTYSSRNSDF